MAIDPTSLANLKAATLSGRPPCAEYLKVTWDTGVVNYYGGAAWNDEAPFTGIGHTIEPRLIYSDKNDPFHELELDPDLRTDEITVTFDDIDKEITGLFQTYGSGVTCEFIYYYPDQSITTTVWSGQLQAPKVYGWKTVKAVATNGFRSRELVIPSRRKPRECTANIFGGLLPDTDAVRSSLCPYDKHLGGSVGNYITGTTPYSDCPKTLEACIDRLGNGGLYFGGFNTDAITVDGGSGYLAVSRKNASALKEPVRVIFGSVHLGAPEILLWRRNGANNDGFVSIVWAICEGPVTSISNFKVNDTMIASTGGTFGNGNMQTRLGTRGQPRTGYAPNVSNFSSTALTFTDYGRVNPTNYSPSNLNGQCDVVGFSEVCVYTDDSPVTKTRIWSDNRVWCLLELYKNQKFGLGYAESLFEILDWMTAATWSDVTVSHTVTYTDGEATVWTSRRSTFNAILEGRPAGEQIEDICRAGAISVPFLHDSKYTISSFRKATSDELTNAPVFYDTGSNVNVAWSGQPLIELSQTPDNKLVNEVEVRFEEASNNGTERPITVDDRNAKLKAGRQQGPDYFLPVPKKFSAFGITTLAEAVRLAYRLLWFGEWDEGGTMNNLRLTLTVPFEQVLGIKRYSVIKVVSQILDGFTVGVDDGATDLTETPTYFRVLSIKRKSGGKAEIVAQVYNHTAYTAFEVDSGGTSVSSNPAVVYGAGIFEVDGSYEYVGQLNSKPSYEYGSNQIQWSSSKWRLYNNGTQVYESSSAVAFPWLASWIVTTPDGVDPAPLVYEGQPINIPVEAATLSATYDDAEGKFVIDIT